MSKNSAEAVEKSVRAVNMPRQTVFSNPDIERVLDIVMSLATELAVTKEHIDTLERVLESSGVLDREALKSFRPSEEVQDERLAGHGEYIARILRVLHQDIEQMKALNEKAL